MRVASLSERIPASVVAAGRDLVFAVDRKLGSAVSSTVVAHHRRRLARIGHERTLDAIPGGWAESATPPREGCSLEVLVDGEAIAPRMAADLAAAESHVYLAGWHFAPDFAMVRGPDAWASRKCRSSAKPSISGIWMSINITSTGSFSRYSRARLPFGASATWKPSASSM